MIKFSSTKPPITKAGLAEVERVLGFAFPKAVREQYLKYNGGHPDKNRLLDAKGVYIVHDFIPVRMIERLIRWLKVDQKVLPGELVPFADDPLGNLYCFSVGEADSGAIYWFEAEGHGRHRLEFLAPSLDEFLSRLKGKGEQ